MIDREQMLLKRYEEPELSLRKKHLELKDALKLKFDPALSGKECVCPKCGKTYIAARSSNGDQTQCKTCHTQEARIRVYGSLENYRTHIIEQIKKTKLEVYGDPYYSNSEKAKESIQNRYKNSELKKISNDKRKRTCVEKYRVDHYFQTEDKKEKTKRFFQQFGVENPMQLPETIEKIKNTRSVRYGDENFNNREKAIKTWKETYGVDHPWKSKIIRDKCQSTNEKITGYKTNLENPRIKQKIKQTVSIQKLDRLKNKMESVDFSLYGWVVSDREKCILKCTKCGKEQAASLKIHYCECRTNEKYTSNAERDIKEYLKDRFELKIHDKKILKNKEIDILIPSKNVGIEYNGLYWHSFESKKNDHLMKYNISLEKGIRLIQIFEDEYVNNKQIVLKTIDSILGCYDQKVYARKCIVKEIKNSDYEIFCDDNHLQGTGKASVRIGLFFKDELIQIMSFSKSRFNKTYQYEIIRECSKLGYLIVGGKSKLFKYFENHYSPDSIISYCDKRWFTGDSYINLGFSRIKDSIPSYYYIDRLTRVNRQNFQKHKLSKLDGFKFDKNLTEFENMSLNGYRRIFDCGQRVFVKTYQRNQNQSEGCSL